MKVLVINTYGGSLLLGAKALPGIEVIGSYEDTGFGSDIQAANFPEVPLVRFRQDWPIQDLSETFVIAHPPCSAFSVQNVSKQNKGVNSAAFACTKSVLEYATSNNAVGIAIESVVGALSGAWPVHQHYADTHGYHLYRILENGCMFGAQWRDRFWAVFIRKGVAPEVMPWILRPAFRTVRQVVGETIEGPAPWGLEPELEKLKNRFRNEAGCTEDEIRAIFEPNPEELCSVDDRLWKIKFGGHGGGQDRWEICKKFVTKYASSAMVLLAPDGLAPVLLGSSWWHLDGRPLSEVAYKRLMGFPDDYIFPAGETRKTNYRADMRTYLSKGVMPPIATWVLQNALTHLGMFKQFGPQVVDGVEDYFIPCQPDHIADFRIRKKDWGQPRPPLRAWEEEHRDRPVQTTTISGDATTVAATTSQPPQPRRERTRVQRVRVPGVRRSKTPWNSPEIETALAETLFRRPNSADEYAYHESHGYHRMGVRPGDTVLDLGAHIGCVASRAALVGAARVVSVEAEPENYALLEQNTRSFPNVETIHGAVYGGTEPTVTLNTVKRRNDGGWSTGTHSVQFRTQGGTISVPRLDLRELLDRYQPTEVKCDIEGSEFSLDWTNLPNSVRSVGIELHTRRDTNRARAKEIVAQLEAQGFKPVHALNMESNFSAIIAFFERPTDQDAGQAIPDGGAVAADGGSAATA